MDVQSDTIQARFRPDLVVFGRPKLEPIRTVFGADSDVQSDVGNDGHRARFGHESLEESDVRIGYDSDQTSDPIRP